MVLKESNVNELKLLAERVSKETVVRLDLNVQPTKFIKIFWLFKY